MPDIKATTLAKKTKSRWDANVEEDDLPAPTTFLRQSGGAATGGIGQRSNQAETRVGGSLDRGYRGETDVQEAMEGVVVQGDQGQDDDDIRADASGEHKHKVCVSIARVLHR